MIRAQVVPAFMAALLGEGVSTDQIERAVARTLDLPLGAALSGLASPARRGVGVPHPMVRAFVFEQARLLERAS